MNVIEKCHEKGRFLNYELCAIVHFNIDNIWRFEYSVNQQCENPLELIDCGSFYVAIDGNEGKPIKAWVEE